MRARRERLVIPSSRWLKAHSEASSAITRGSPKRSPGAGWPSWVDGSTTRSSVAASGAQAADAEVVGVVDGCLGPQRAALLEVLLDLGGALVDLDRGLDTAVEDAG